MDVVYACLESRKGRYRNKRKVGGGLNKVGSGGHAPGKYLCILCFNLTLLIYYGNYLNKNAALKLHHKLQHNIALHELWFYKDCSFLACRLAYSVVYVSMDMQ